MTLEFGVLGPIDVSDDGVGFSETCQAGVGLSAMRERAIELGGAFAVQANRPRGTRVHVAIPIAAR